MLRIRGRKLLFLLSRRGVKWETGVDFENVTWVLPRGDKVWRGNQRHALSSRNVYLCIYLCEKFFSVKIPSFFFVFFSWNLVETEVVYFFNKLWSSLTFHGNRLADYPRWRIKTGRNRRGAFVLAATQTSLEVTLALLISEGLKGPMS